MLRETLIGLIIGSLVGFVAGLIAFIWQGVIRGEEAGIYLAVAITLSLSIVCTLAAFLGYFVPHMLRKVKLDQASVTGPIITTLKDITGLLVYFGLVMLFVTVIGGVAVDYGICYCPYCEC